MDISKLSLIELKAMGYDVLAQLELLQKNLGIINAQITKLNSEAKDVVPEVEKVEEKKD